MTVMPGTQKITMGKNRNPDYAGKLDEYKRKGANPYMQGIQDPEEAYALGAKDMLTKYGMTTAISNSRHPIYAAPNVTQGGLSQPGFQQPDSPANVAQQQPTSGSLELSTSMTNKPQVSPDQIMDARTARMQTIANAAGMQQGAQNGQWEALQSGQPWPGLNNRKELVS